jgi:hypothetical protein
MAGHQTDTDDLVERLEDSKGWPNLGKAAAARIRELEAENARLRYVLGGVAAAIDTGRNEPLVIWLEQIEIARAALEENATDNAPKSAGSVASRSARQPAISEPR